MAVTVKSGENLFLSLGFSPIEAEVLQFRADLVSRLRLWIQANHLDPDEAAERLRISPAKANDLMRGRWKKFTLDALVSMAARAGLAVLLRLEEAA